MKYTFYLCNLLTVLLSNFNGTLSLFLNDDEQIQRIQELRSDGFDEFERTTLHEIAARKKREVDGHHIRQRRSVDEISIQFIAFGEMFNFRLNKAPKVLHRHAIILSNDGNTTTTYEGEHPDCFLTGHVVSHTGSASVSYCDTLLGSMSNDSHTLHFEEIPRHLRKRDTESNLLQNLLVARQRKSETSMGVSDDDSDVYSSLEYGSKSELQYDRRTPEIDDDTDWYSSLEQIDDQGTSGFLRRENKYNLHSSELRRRTSKFTGRESIPFQLTAELAVYAEETFTARLPKNMKTRLEIMLLKWSGVAYEYSKDHQLGHKIEIQLKRIEFFDKNPSWLKSDRNQKIGNILKTFRIETHKGPLKYDLTYLHLGFCSRVSKALGLAQTRGMCKASALDCMTILTAYEAITHELGHTLGMRHDTGNCRKGVMGGNGADFSECSKRDFGKYLSNVKRSQCLWTKNIPDGNVIKELKGKKVIPQLVGQLYSPDDTCRILYGSGMVRWRPDELCSRLKQCVQRDSKKRDYNVFANNRVYFPGETCGDGKVCQKRTCLKIEDVFGQKAKFQTGSWGSWGKWGKCSGVCDGNIRVRHRQCNSPIPINSPYCKGSSVDIRSCRNKACPSNFSPTDFLKETADKFCKMYKTSGYYDSSEYLDTGDRYASDGDRQCHIRCNRMDKRERDKDILGLFPDGSPCQGSNRKWTKHCVAGYCMDI